MSECVLAVYYADGVWRVRKLTPPELCAKSWDESPGRDENGGENLSWKEEGIKGFIKRVCLLSNVSARLL